MRLILSHWTIWRLCRNSESLDDPKINALLNTVQLQLNCDRKVQLHESTATSAAFTVGWLRPKICLSNQWRSWESLELEATLAHEVAHINAGDFLQRVIAQFSAALNFYNPIVHYLCSQLCIDQEFNADARAAEIVGGQKKYLNTLASIALQNDYSNHRLAPMFLPTRKSFFRRIEMLRSKQTSRIETPLGKLFSMVLVGLIVVSVAGFRFPVESVATVVVDSRKKQESKPSDLRYVANDADAMIVMRPKRILEKELMRQAYDAFEGSDDDMNQFDELLEDMFGVKAEAIDQLTGVISDIEPDGTTLVGLPGPTATHGGPAAILTAI